MSSQKMTKEQKEDAQYCFEVEFFDKQADLVRKYTLTYFTTDGSVEMFDLKARRVFLKRCPYPSLKLSDLYIGNQVTVFSRLITLVGFGDEWTRRKLSAVRQTALCLIPPSSYEHAGQLLDSISAAGHIISKLRLLTPSKDTLVRFAELTQNAQFAQDLAGPVTAVELQLSADKAAVQQWGDVIVRPQSDSLAAELALWFGSAQAEHADSANVTCCIIKPHAVQSGLLGKIVQNVLDEGFEISAMQLFHLSREEAVEFLEVYKGVISEYNAMVEDIIAGPCVALQVRGTPSSDGQITVVSEFRQLCGPSDSEIARALRKNSLRAKFGVDKVSNAVHCTDLPEDGPLESAFFFDLLASRAVRV